MALSLSKGVLLLAAPVSSRAAGVPLLHISGDVAKLLFLLDRRIPPQAGLEPQQEQKGLPGRWQADFGRLLVHGRRDGVGSGLDRPSFLVGCMLGEMSEDGGYGTVSSYNMHGACICGKRCMQRILYQRVIITKRIILHRRMSPFWMQPRTAK